MKKMTSINIDKWRTLSEVLFKGYIETYDELSKNESLNPAKILIKNFENLGIKKALTEDGYGTAYTIAREIGVYYEEDGKHILSSMAKAFLEKKLTYSDYLKYYCLNIEFLINDIVVHPFSIIMDVLKDNNFSKEEIRQRCPSLIPPTSNSSATDCLRLFLNRCVEANLLKKNDSDYSLNYKYDILKGSLNKSDYTSNDFENIFINGNQAQAQKNIVTKLLEREIPNLFEHSFGIKKNDIKDLDQSQTLELFNDIKQDLFDLSSFQENCKIAGLNYSNPLITRYISSLATKPFVLLSGLSGSGKTKLAQAYAQWICESEEQYCIVPVGADWTNREPLLGYVNALDNKEYILPENGALNLIIKANTNQEKPYFLILDEMNLSHVERYFADFLSVMESKDEFKLHNGSAINVPQSIGWPANLFVVGTVNIDETTYMFSPKVLDRANVIEFRMCESDLENYFKPETKPLDMKKLWQKDSKIGLGAQFGEDFVAKSIENTSIENLEYLNTELINFFRGLESVGTEFGYRTASEIQTLYRKIDIINPNYDKEDGFTDIYSENYNFKIDVAIMQKLLPKLHGSRRKLSKPLTILAGLCLKEESENIFNENGEININKGLIKYPLSFYKIARMYKSAIENGFASYAEA